MSPDDAADKDRANLSGAEFWKLRMEEKVREAGPALRDDIARLVAVLEEAGEPLGTTEASWRLTDAGATSDWVVVYMTALKEGAVWTPETGMVSIPPKKGSGMSPEERALCDAFDKAERLGVIRQEGERFVLTGRSGDGQLTPAELDMAMRHMECCNALDCPEVNRMRRLWVEGKVAYEELDALENEVFRRADEEHLQRARVAARKKVDKA